MPFKCIFINYFINCKPWFIIEINLLSHSLSHGPPTIKGIKEVANLTERKILLLKNLSLGLSVIGFAEPTVIFC